MPHIIVKIAAGRSDAEKTAMAEAVARAVMATAGVADDAVSVDIEEIAKEAWVEQVYKPDILPRLASLHKRPGYDPL